MSEDLRAYFAAEVPLPDWTERTAVIDYLVGYERQTGGLRSTSTRRTCGRSWSGSSTAPAVAAGVTNHALAEEVSCPAGGLTRSPPRPW